MSAKTVTEIFENHGMKLHANKRCSMVPVHKGGIGQNISTGMTVAEAAAIIAAKPERGCKRCGTANL